MLHIVAALTLSVPPNLIDSFSSTQQNYCGGGFPQCPSENVSFTLFTALELAKGKTREGPSSILPDNENQILVTNGPIGMQWGMFVDLTVQPPKIINCTRFPLGENLSVKVLRESWVGYLATEGAEAGTVTCNATKECTKYEWNHTFGAGCAGVPKTGQEPEVWFVGTSAFPPSSSSASQPGQHSFPLIAMHNDIFYPVCNSSVQYRWYHSDWSADFQSPAPDTLFTVPDDANCPLMTPSNPKSAASKFASTMGGAWSLRLINQR